MDQIEKQERKREARRRLRAQRRRAGELRGRVVAVSLIAFVGLWGVVFVQMATGNDPVLGSGRPARRSPRSSGSHHRSQAQTESRTTPAPEAPESEPVEEAVPEVAPIEEEVAPVEEESFEPEPEPEPAPVTTSQS
jgi:hypothetical protein